MNDQASHRLLDPSALPERFAGVDELEEFMTRPAKALVDDLSRIDGDILVLGVGGKMGPTLARLAKCAAPGKQVIGVARFSEAGLRQKLEAAGITCIAADILDRAALAKLPDCANVIYMAGRKFGSTGAEHLTWSMNALAPALVAERYAKARIVAFSTGCVYPYVPTIGGGATEETPAKPPPGEYAYSCLARERMFEHFSRQRDTAGRLIRLNYAIDMRYGVLYDIASKVLRGEPIELATGHVNVIWQGDANAQILRALGHVTRPTSPLNVSGPEVLSTRALATLFGQLLGRAPVFTGSEASTAWLVNTALAARLFGYPVVPLRRMAEWTADWVKRDLPSLGKPTHYETRSGDF
ncbi:MAG: NAD(P)-dependent oxidoreductase [Alphaproteobacteria bacterium]|nr:NAD(P)-dependent oxidoreductase [Alphaproteobacteria bacterium]